MRTLKNSEQLWSVTEASSRIVLVGHANPDGDAIGSVTGLYHFLAQTGKTAKMMVPNHFPDFLSCLNPDDNPILFYDSDSRECDSIIAAADLIVCLDMSAPHRADAMADAILNNRSAKKVLIDHHLNPETGHFDIVVSDTEVSSTCELLLSLILKSPVIGGDILKLNMDCATSLTAGILTDTNNFSNSIFPGTLERMSLLLQRGVDRNRLYDEIFCSYSVSRMRLMGHVLSDKMQLIHDGSVAFIVLDNEDKERYSFNNGDAEGFVNLPLRIRKVRMSALFKEDDGFIKVSLRSKGNLDVNTFARQYCNGGGHLNASGGRLNMSVSEIAHYFSECVEDYFKKA